ncbi:hypothetical protein [Emticicia sp. 17c]|uniref:hypothetical protein n=1 Tax=Emticicia sp. 17c TaxID=3127704 RepID=UPI00301BCB2C
MLAYLFEMSILENIENTIAFLSDDLAQLQDPFYIIGSSALVLAGIPLSIANDIDLLTSERDAAFLKKLWHKHIQESYFPEGDDKFRSNFGRFRLNEAIVEVMGHLEVFNEGFWQKLEVKETKEIAISKLIIQIPTLKEQYRILHLFGRTKDLAKADKIVEAYNSTLYNGN